MKSKMYSFESRIRYSETGQQGKLKIESLIDYFQDCSTFQSEELGLGVAYLQQFHLAWVLSSWQIVIEEYPVLCDSVVVGTFPYDFKGFWGSRNFFMKDNKGKHYACANSLWALIDTREQHPIRPPKDILEGYVLEKRLDMDYAPRKIAVQGEGCAADPIKIREYHLDSNHHVNNAQYIKIATSCIPGGLEVGQLRAEYKKQAMLDDIMIPVIYRQENRYTVSLCDEGKQPYAVIELTVKQGRGR